MQDQNNGNPLTIVSILSAYISIGTVQQYTSVIAGIVAIVSGIMAIRYYYYKTKNTNNV
jgi:hypothetical protein